MKKKLILRKESIRKLDLGLVVGGAWTQSKNNDCAVRYTGAAISLYPACTG